MQLAPNSFADMHAVDSWNQPCHYNAMTQLSSWHRNDSWHHDTCLYGLQQALNVTDQVFLILLDTFAPCGQLQVAS